MDFEGHVTKVQQLPLAAKSLISEGPFLYAWCPAQLSFDKWKGALYGKNFIHLFLFNNFITFTR